MQNDMDSRSFASSPMLLSLKDRKTKLATFVNNHASDSLEYDGPRFSEHVVAMIYVAVDCIANSRSITVLPSDVRDGIAMHVARCLVDTYNLAHSDGHPLRGGPTVGAKAANTREEMTTEVAQADQGSAARGALAEGFELEANKVDGRAAHTNNGSVEQQPEEQRKRSILLAKMREIRKRPREEPSEQQPVQQNESEEQLEQ